MKPRSLAALRSTIIRLIQHLGETTNADAVRPEHIEAWLIGGGWQGRTRKGYLTDATTFFSERGRFLIMFTPPPPSLNSQPRTSAFPLQLFEPTRLG